MNQMNKSFNLVKENWIPVVDLKGNYSRISLNELFTNGISYADLAVRPHERVALMRLLLCISHAALGGPEDVEEWQKVPMLLPVKSKSYLKKWEDSFDLFSVDKPFLQIPGLVKAPKLKKESEKDADSGEEEYLSIGKLDFTLASANNPTLFDHSALSDTPRKYNPADIAVQLLAFQNFFLAGGKTSSMIWGGEALDVKPPNPGDGPCSPSSMYHCYIRGNSILETIHMNLITKNDLSIHYNSFDTEWLGYPIWEKFPIKRSDVDYIKNATETYLGRLVPLTRLLIILPDCEYMSMGEGLQFPSFKPNNPYVPEITATVVIREKDKKQTHYLLGVSMYKSPWRDLPAMLVKRKSGLNGGPLCFNNLDQNTAIDIHILALEREQASALQLIESVYSLPSQIFSDEGRSAYEKGVNTAELISHSLGGAIDKYRKSIDGGWEGRLKSAGSSKMDLLERLHSRATIHYWTVVEKSLKILMDYVESIGSTPESVTGAKKRWESVLFKAARESYILVCPNKTPRQMRAFAFGWQIINSDNRSKNQDKEKKEGNE